MRCLGASGLVLLNGCRRPAVQLPWQNQPPEAAQELRIGFISIGSDEPTLALLVVQKLQEHHIRIEARFADGHADRLPLLAQELVRLDPAVIVAYSEPAALAAQAATTTIPIVFMGAADPVGARLVQSIARPGGNVTGLSDMTRQITAKWLEILKEVSPRLSRVAVLWNAGDGTMTALWRETQEAAQVLHLQLQSFAAHSFDDIDRAFEAFTAWGPNALIVPMDPELLRPRMQAIVDFAVQSRLPACSQYRPFAEAGGFLSYGRSVKDEVERVASYVDKILRGTRPADLPVEQPMRFDVVINLQTARAMDLTVPEPVLMQATEIIQ